MGRAEAATPYFALFFASAPKLSAQVGDPVRLCVPFRFWSDESQPIARSPELAYGACSDAIQYVAFLDGGEILISAQLGKPVVLEALPGTAISYSPTDPLPMPCDAGFIGLPFPVTSPCRLRSVTATHDASQWLFDDASGAASFEVSGTVPRVFLPEPGPRLALLPAFVALRGLAGAKRRRRRRRARGGVARPIRGGGGGARVSVLLLLATTLTACSAQRVALTPTILLPPSSVGAGASIALSPVVEGIPEPIGRPTTSLLHIPSGRVDLDRGAESIVDGMRRSLEASGYRVTRPGENATDPVLVGRVERMRFRSNDWAAPIVFIGGEIELSLSLVDSSGATRWEQTYHRSYKDDGVRISFEDALNETFDKVLAGAMQDFGSDAFREACCTARPQAPRSSATDSE